MLPAELGAYLLALLEQWSSKEVQAIPDEPARLTRITGLAEFPQAVRVKFIAVEINGAKYLRNERLAREWDKAKREHDAKVQAGKLRAEQVAQLSAGQAAELPHNSQLTTHNSNGKAQKHKQTSAAGKPPRAKVPAAELAQRKQILEASRRDCELSGIQGPTRRESEHFLATGNWPGEGSRNGSHR
jgi:hypothetical protein